jgi:chromosomal replication initiation ATPase DnaA
MGHQEEFAVGGLLRSVRRVEGAGGVVRKRRLVSGDERILGSGEYVAKVLRVVEQRARRKAGLKRRLTPSIVVKMAAEAAAAEERDVLGRNRQAKLVKARFLACKWLVDDLGTRVVDVAKVFKVTPPAVCHAVSKGRSVESEIGASM